MKKPTSNTQSFSLITAIIVLIVSIVISSLVTLYIVFETGNSSKVSSAAMKSMMGSVSTNGFILKTSIDRVERLPYVEKGNVKEFTLTADPIRWEFAKGQSVLAWGFNGQIPGPEIRVEEGETVRVLFTNNLPQPTTVHWHGVAVPNSQDGVPGVTQAPVQPGETFTYEFIAQPAGTRFYHTHGSSHADEAAQLDMGLSGAFVIEPKAKRKYDREYTLLLDEWEVLPDGVNAAIAGHTQSGGHASNYNVFTINGKAFPDIDPLVVKTGEKIVLRLMNAGTSTIHPMHLHGHSFRIISVDGNPIPFDAQLTRDVVAINPGERYDIEFVADNPGVWLFHCHELHHADAGMIIPIVYQGFEEKLVRSNTTRTIDHSKH